MKDTYVAPSALVLAWLVLGLHFPALAQEKPQPDRKVIIQQMRVKDGQVFYLSKSGVPADQGDTMQFMVSELSADKTVVGKPYSAEAITEFSQTLGDGNRIYRKTAARLYRDSEGRTRREQALETPGTGIPESRMIIISDPVEGMTYALNPSTRIARKTMRTVVKIAHSGKTKDEIVSAGAAGTNIAHAAIGSPITMRVFGAGTGDMSGPIRIAGPNLQEAGKKKTEPLGTRVIDGIQAEGTRTTITIPAGAMGNELPIEIVSEEWYSPDLELIISSRQSDPRVGETVYRLTNINLSEPSPSLFELPANYKLMEDAIWQAK